MIIYNKGGYPMSKNNVPKNQLYFEFMYDEYMKRYGENKYLYDLLDSVDWSSVPDSKNDFKVGADGYSPRAMCKALFLKLVKRFSSINELIFFLKNNPKLASNIGFDPIKNRIPHESTFSKFRKSFECNLIFHVIANTITPGIEMGIFDPSTITIDSYPILFNSFFNNKKSFNKKEEKDFNKYYTKPIEADFGVKTASNDKPVYDKNGKPKKAISYLGYKVNSVSFLNVPIFSIVTPASPNDLNYFIPLIQKVLGFLEIDSFNVLADKGYDVIRFYDYVHEQVGGKAYIPLKNSFNNQFVGDCGKKLSFHSHYFDKKRQHFRFKYKCDNNSNCFGAKKCCYRYKDHSESNFRELLSRKSVDFKKRYKKRTLIESIFSKLESIFKSTSLRFVNSVQLDANLSNLYLIASAFLAHKLGRDDLIASPKSTMYEYNN